MQESSFKKSFILVIMAVVYLTTMSVYYIHSKRRVFKTAVTEVENILLTHRALRIYIHDEQIAELNRLKENNLLVSNYFSKKIMSNTYISSIINKLTNIERIKNNISPFYLKFISDNPLNLDNFPNSYEKKILEFFRKTKKKKYETIINKNNRKYLLYAVAGPMISKGCLQCHGDPKAVPKNINEDYGVTNGYYKKEGEIDSLIRVEMPLELLYKNNFKNFLYDAVFIFFIFLVLTILTLFVRNLLRHRDHLHASSNKMKQSLYNYSKHIIRSKMDTQGVFIDVSIPFCELTGYKKDELIGENQTILCINNKQKTIYAQMQIVLLQGHTYKIEMQNKAKDGSYFWVFITATPIRNTQDRIIEFEIVYTNISKQKSLEEDANQDSMTNLLNRRSFDTKFLQQYEYAKEKKLKFGFLMIDIDFFKLYNDRYGHLEGDTVLKKISKCMKSTFKNSSNLIFRLGGEEFGIIIVHKSAAQIIKKAKIVCKNIQELNIPHEDNHNIDVVTVSIGLYITKFRKEITFSQFYRKSDSLLYDAKHLGKNRVIHEII